MEERGKKRDLVFDHQGRVMIDGKPFIVPREAPRRDRGSGQGRENGDRGRLEAVTHRPKNSNCLGPGDLRAAAAPLQESERKEESHGVVES